MSKDVRFAPKEEQCPHHEAGTFADQHQQRRLAKIDPVKAERDGKDIADKGKPGQQGEPCPVPVYFAFVLDKRFVPDPHVFFDPLPFAEPSEPIGGQSAEPVAQCGDCDAEPNVSPGREHSHQLYVRTERHDRSGYERAEEKAEIAQIKQPFHLGGKVKR